MITLEHIDRGFARKNPLLEVRFEPTTFQIVSPCHGFAFLTGICISPIDHSAPISNFRISSLINKWKSKNVAMNMAS